jgi:hypothetical protein
MIVPAALRTVTTNGCVEHFVNLRSGLLWRFGDAQRREFLEREFDERRFFLGLLLDRVEPGEGAGETSLV